VARVSLLLAFCILHFAFCISSRAQWTNQFKFIDPSGILLTNRTVLFTPRSAPQTNGSLTISADRLRFVTDTNGSNQIRLYQGGYDVRIMASGGTGETLFTINVPSGTGLTNGLNLISPIVDPSVASGYTRSQSDARYLMTTNGNATNLTAQGTFTGSHSGTYRGAVTNLNGITNYATLVAGSNVTITTDIPGNTITINSSGGGAGLAAGTNTAAGAYGDIQFADGSGGFLRASNNALNFDPVLGILNLFKNPGSTNTERLTIGNSFTMQSVPTDKAVMFGNNFENHNDGSDRALTNGPVSRALIIHTDTQYGTAGLKYQFWDGVSSTNSITWVTPFNLFLSGRIGLGENAVNDNHIDMLQVAGTMAISTNINPVGGIVVSDDGGGAGTTGTGDGSDNLTNLFSVGDIIFFNGLGEYAFITSVDATTVGLDRPVTSNEPDSNTYIACQRQLLFNNATGTASRYAHEATALHGLPSIVATSSSTAKTNTAAYTGYIPVTTGYYRVTFLANITRAASSSSTLGPAWITYKDARDGALKNQTNTTFTISNNTTNVSTSASITAYCQAGQAILCSINQTTSGGTTMMFNADFIIEKF
jgi:hypothetical protein